MIVRQVRLVPISSTRPAAHDGPPAETLVDLRLDGQRVIEVAPGLSRRPHEEEIDGEGRWAIPGLWDQHIHSGQWARSFTRLDLSATASAADVVALVRESVAFRPPAPGTVLEGYGFRDALWPDQPTTTALDQVVPDVPVVLVSADVHCGWLNGAAQRHLGVQATDGLIREHEWFDLLALLGRRRGPHDGYPTAVARAAARGVTGIVDMEFAANHRLWPDRVGTGVDSLRVRTGVYLDDLDDAIAAGLRTGDPLPGGAGLVTMGPVKVISDGALNTRTAYCHEPYGVVSRAEGEEPAVGQLPFGEQTVAPDELTDIMVRARAAGLRTAIHAIGDASVGIVLDAYAASGAAGTVEHAQLVSDHDLPRFAELGVGASVQPAHLLDDRDVAEACWPGRGGRAFPLRALVDSGARLVLGSDAPVAPLDPWLAMAAAVHRSGDERPPWHSEQQITPAEALAASTDGWGTIAPGHPSDVVLLDADPLAPAATSADAARRLREMPVAATIVAGRFSHGG